MLYKSIQTLSIADWSPTRWSCSLTRRKRSVKVKKILVRRQRDPLWTRMERWTPGPELHAILSQDRAEMRARGTAYAHNNSSPGFTWLGRGQVWPMTLKIKFSPVSQNTTGESEQQQINLVRPNYVIPHYNIISAPVPGSVTRDWYTWPRSAVSLLLHSFPPSQTWRAVQELMWSADGRVLPGSSQRERTFLLSWPTSLWCGH